MSRTTKEFLSVNPGFCIAVVIFLCILMASCSPKTVYVPVTQTQSSETSDSLARLMMRMLIHQQETKQTDSFRHIERFSESTVVNENGDTMRHDTHSDITTDRERSLENTIRIQQRTIDSLSQVKNRVDSVDRPVPYPVDKIVEVEKPLKWWQSALIWWGLVASVILGLMIFRILRK